MSIISIAEFLLFQDDFKPASVDTSQMASLNIEEEKSVTVNVPHIEVDCASQYSPIKKSEYGFSFSSFNFVVE